MAVTIKCYGNLGTQLANKSITWGTDTVKLSLHTSSYAVAQGTDQFFSDTTNEIAAGGGYSSGGFSLASMTLSYDATTREERYLAANVSVSSLTPASPFRYGVIYDVTASNALLAYINFGADQDPAGLPFAIQWASTGVFYNQAS